MDWVCSKDGKLNTSDLFVCPVCGTARPSRVVLTGCIGNAELRLETVIGSALLADVVGDEARFCHNPQYRICCGEDNVWRVFPAEEITSNITVVNGVEVMKEGISLNTGDVIAVASRKDSTKTAAAVKVEIIPL